MKLRLFSPWLIAAAACLAVAFGIRSMSMSLPVEVKKNIVTEGALLAGTNRLTRLPSATSLSESLIATLSFVPENNKSVPLIFTMIENHEDARPYQQGLSSALAVFELIVEGDITRFMGAFRADRLPPIVGPVRSLREHFVSIAIGYKPLLLHAGGHPLAYEALARNRDILHHDGIRYDGQTYERNPDIPAPHNLFMRRAPLQALIEETNIQPFRLPLFPTCSGAACNLTNGDEATKITLNMSSPDHDVTYLYKSLLGSYIRSIAGSPHQAQPKTIAILETTVEGFHQKGYVPWTQTIGEGKMLLFRNGKVMDGMWKRKKGEPFVFVDGEEEILKIAPGEVWITMLPSLSLVEWES
ncbi:MAG TPA: DUF3048 domain-containing protein [Candidatus Peribacterales bacterium]|nr:DUF3048 domain-containing protein [Candidatus Peribacterales bacterium]